MKAFARIPRALWVIAGFVLLRIAAAGVSPLIDDEAYYWLWARRLDWGYLDHPPLIAWLIALTTRLGDGAFLIRVSPLILGGLTTYALFLLGRELFDARAGIAAGVLFQVIPVLAGAGLLATPDAPLLLCWAAALRFAWQALHGRPGRWLTAGVAVGFGLLSKIPMVLLAAGLVLYVILRSSRSLRAWQPYAAAALAVALFSPVVLWNARHGWAGLEYVLTGRLTTESPSVVGITGIGKLLEEQMPFALVLLPAYVWALIVPLRARNEPMTFLALVTLPALVFPFIPAYAGAWPHGNWLAPAYLAFSVVLGAVWSRPVAVLAGVNGAAIVLGLLTSVLPVLPLPPGAEEVYGWREAGARVTTELHTIGPGAAVVTDRYQIASQLGYYARGVPVTLLPCPRPGSIWTRPQVLAGHPGIAVIDARWNPSVRWEAFASQVVELAPLTIEVRGRALRTFRFYRLDALTPPGSCP
jgi:4-amino-4-deoxy-L-arabinose transferase-like glycosyltransferase